MSKYSLCDRTVASLGMATDAPSVTAGQQRPIDPWTSAGGGTSRAWVLSRLFLCVLGILSVASELERSGLLSVLIESLGDSRVPPVKHYKCTKCCKCHVVGSVCPRRSYKQVAHGFKTKCFICGMQGHRMVECSRSQSSKDAPDVFQGKCAGCGKWEHKVVNCPRWMLRRRLC